MTDHLPERLDLPALAEAGRVLRGHIPVAWLERAGPALADTAGELEVELRFGKDPAGTRYLSVDVHGSVAQVCQRCLQAVQVPLKLHSRLGLVQEETEAAALPERYEPLLLTGEPASIAEIVTDEVLLALPLVPLHVDDERCSAVTQDYRPSAADRRDSPFAALVALKEKQT